VENVLDSVVEALLRDPNRKFVFAEMVSALNSEVFMRVRCLVGFECEGIRFGFFDFRTTQKID
jgi:hypothetical protein